MDYQKGKTARYTCKNNKCNSVNETVVHWKMSVVFTKCVNCKKVNRIEFITGEEKKS